MSKKKSKKSHTPFYHFRLFVADDEPNSRLAKEIINNICQTHLKGKYALEFIDVLEDFKTALENNILFAPTLIVTTPKFQFRIVGSLSDTNKILKAIGVSPERENK